MSAYHPNDFNNASDDDDDDDRESEKEQPDSAQKPPNKEWLAYQRTRRGKC
jgi:hypothetical protein